MLTAPYYNKCTQKGLVKYYNAIADAVKIPVLAYNVPGRTGVTLTPATAVEISKNPYIAGLKEAGGNLAQICGLAHALKNKTAFYSGEDESNLVYFALGAHGCVSVAANAIPEKIVALFESCRAGDLNKALELHDKMYEFCGALFCEVNPIPVKAVMHYLGFCTDEMRAPLTVIEEQNRDKLIASFKNLD
jgi:4-hydroxy-tetrahydrodipicolinate synthase